MSEHDEALEPWVDEAQALEECRTGEGRTTAFVRLMAGARRAVTDMTDEDAAALLDAVRKTARERHRQQWRTWAVRGVASLAASLALIAVSIPPPRKVSPSAEASPERTPVVVRQLAFEATIDGKVVSLELTLHRRPLEERNDAPMPSL